MKKKLRSIAVLLIEDNPGDVLLVKEFLQEEFESVDLTHVSTLRAAKIQIGSGASFDTILLDLSLPDSRGIVLVDKILALAESVPVIVLTGYSNLEFSIESLSKGISDYLLKDDLSSALLYKSIIYSFERNTFSDELKKSERNYRHLFEFSPVPMWVYDLHSLKILDVNKAAIQHYGYSEENFLSFTLRDIRPAESVGALESAIESVRLDSSKTAIGVYTHQKKSGEEIQVEVRGSSIEYKGHEARLVLAEDITEKLAEQNRLKQLESVVTNTTESVVILEAEPTTERGRKILYVNDAFTKMTQYSRQEVLGNTLHFLNGPETSRKEISRLNKAMQKRKICRVEFINYKKDGTPFWINTSMVPVRAKEGNLLQWVAIGRDISKQKAYEKRLKSSLKEKEVLLSEIHHRVKNNLAVISSLMQLQAFKADSEELSGKLHDSVFRISTMSAIHEILYQSGNFSKLVFSDIIEKLIANLERVLGDGKNIEYEIEKKPIELNINQAIPCALMMNEVVTNIYKHAFKNRESGRIGASLELKEGYVYVEISDNGIGLPEGIDPVETDTLGLHLIQILTTQLRGESDLRGTENGTVFSLRFKKSDVSGIGNSHL